MKRKNLILTATVAFLSVALAMVIGFSISNMTGETVKSSSTEEDVTESASSNEETETVPDTTEETKMFEMDDTFREITADGIEAIRSGYDGTMINYYTKPDLNDDNRPVEATYFDYLFNTRADGGARTMNTKASRVTLSFVLTMEYDGYTEYLLNYLTSKNAKAVFYVSFSYAFNYPDIVERILRDGHTLGSLGYSLPEGGFASMTLEDQYDDLKRMHEYIYDKYGYSMEHFFFENGSFNYRSIKLVKEAGYQVRFYTVSYPDEDHDKVIAASDFLADMSGKAHAGAVYFFHTTNTATIIVIPSLIDALREKGYEVGLYQ